MIMGISALLGIVLNIFLYLFLISTVITLASYPGLLVFIVLVYFMIEHIVKKQKAIT